MTDSEILLKLKEYIIEEGDTAWADLSCNLDDIEYARASARFNTVSDVLKRYWELKNG